MGRFPYTKGVLLMSVIYKSLPELIGHTPLLELCRYEKQLGLKAKVVAKLECFNPAGSAKDRIAKKMIEDAEKEGALKEGSVIIEPTSGNTGIGLACVAASKGYRVILTMPETMSQERRKLLRAYGAELVLTEGAKGMQGAVDKARELAEKMPGSFIPGQFDNPSNPEAHRLTTGPEIWEDTDGGVDIFVAGIGTGGTVSGAGSYLKSRNPKIRVVGVEPASSPLLTQGKAGPHKIQGIGANFVPKNLDRAVCDEIIPVKDEDAFAAGRAVARAEGLLAGISSGAAVWAAAELARRPENQGKTIVALLPDTGDRYLSTTLFMDD
jgi:cysteine synthase A